MGIMPDIHSLYPLISTKPCKFNMSIPILQAGKQTQRVKQPVQGPAASDQQIWD